MGRIRPRHVDDPVSAGRRIHQARVEAGLSLRDIALPGCSPSFLSRVEAGQRVPSVAIVLELADRLGVEPDHLLGKRLDNRMSESELAAAEVSARLRERGARETSAVLLEQARLVHDARAESRLLEALGILELEDGDAARAVELLNAARTTDRGVSPRTRPALLRALGRAYAAGGDLARAIAVLSEAFDQVAGEPHDVALTAQFGTLLASAYTEHGQPAAAERVLDTVLADEAVLAGDGAEVEWRLSRAYAERGETAVADAYARRVLARLDAAEEDLLLGRAHQQLGSVLVAQGRSEEALVHLERSAALLGEDAPMRLWLDRARVGIAAGRPEEAERFARAALDRSGADDREGAGGAQSVLAEVQLKQGNLDAARRACQEAIALLQGTSATAELGRVYETLASVEEAAGNLEAALAALRARPTGVGTRA
jgi:tetratricopeptide (TPR) repeat protein